MAKYKHKFILCPVCQKHKFPEPGDYTFCPFCGWCHDAVSESEEYLNTAIGPNRLSLVEHKARYQQFISQNPAYHYKRDGFPQDSQAE